MKKKIFVVALAACLLILSVAGSSMAYFTDIEDATNTFTVGNVDIKLSEINPENGQLTEIVNPITGFEYENIYPTQVIPKQPTITNVSSTNDSVYTAAKITLTNASDLLADEAAVKAFLAGGALNTDGFASAKYVIDTTSKTITVYAIINAPLAKDASVDIFTNVVIPGTWDNDQMATFGTMKITINAYATQTAGFTDATTAITTAFADNGWGTYNQLP